MSDATHLTEALGRIRAVFQGTVGIELTDSDVAKLAGLDAEEYRILLGVLQQTGAIERPRGRIFLCRPLQRVDLVARPLLASCPGLRASRALRLAHDQLLAHLLGPDMR